MNPDLAYDWMRNHILQRGALTQAEAACFLLQFADDRLAYVDEFGGSCVGRPVLARFRRRSPEMRFDRAGKCWRLPSQKLEHQQDEHDYAA